MENGKEDSTQGGASGSGSDATADFVKRLEILEKENRKLKDENAERRLKNKEAADEAARLAAEQGQYKTQAEILQKRVQELETLEPAAKSWMSFQEQELARIEAMKADLPQHWKESLDAVPTLDGKRAIVRAYEAEKSSKTEAGTKEIPRPKNGSGPPPVDGTDWQALQNDPAALRAAKIRDPSGWDSFKASLRGASQRRLTTFEARQLAQKKA